MARIGNGSTQYLSAPADSVTALAYPFTFAVWFRIISGASNGRRFFGASQPASGINVEVNLFLTDVNRLGLILDTSALSYLTLTAATVTDTNWHHGCGRCVSATDRSVFLDGVPTNDNRSITRPNTTQWQALAHQRHTDDGGWANFTNADVAFGCVWTADLTDEEVFALANGAHPLSIRPNAIRNYWPLDGDSSPEVDLIGGRTLTVTGATKSATNPPVPHYAEMMAWLKGVLSIPLEASAGVTFAASATLGTVPILLASAAAFSIAVTTATLVVPMPLVAAATIQFSALAAMGGGVVFSVAAMLHFSTAANLSITPVTFEPFFLGGNQAVPSLLNPV